MTEETSPKDVWRAERPLQDGEVTVFYEDVQGATSVKYTYEEIKAFTYNSIGIEFALFNGFIHTIASSRVIEVLNRGNSKEWRKANDDWAEVDHQYHTEDAPERTCLMCLETSRSNAAISLLGSMGLGYRGEEL